MIDEDLKRKKEKKQRTIIERFFSELLEKCASVIAEKTMDELFDILFGNGDFDKIDFDEIEFDMDEFETEDSDF